MERLLPLAGTRSTCYQLKLYSQEIGVTTEDPSTSPDIGLMVIPFAFSLPFSYHAHSSKESDTHCETGCLSEMACRGLRNQNCSLGNQQDSTSKGRLQTWSFVSVIPATYMCTHMYKSCACNTDHSCYFPISLSLTTRTTYHKRALKENRFKMHHPMEV